MANDYLTECTTCCEKTPRPFIAIIDGSAVCDKCICQIFQLAIDNEDNYPAKWGRNFRLQPEEYAHVVPGELAEKYRAKEKEYLTPVGRRLYCSKLVPARKYPNLMPPEGCGAFIGELQMLPDKYPGPLITLCQGCKSLTCIHCGREWMRAHVCKDEYTTPSEDDKAFEGLVSGKDYQLCPNKNCGRRIQLWYGCNKITCRCGTRFCYICGEHADYTHFMPREEGGCPANGRVGDERAFYAAQVPRPVLPGRGVLDDPMAANAAQFGLQPALAGNGPENGIFQQAEMDEAQEMAEIDQRIAAMRRTRARRLLARDMLRRTIADLDEAETQRQPPPRPTPPPPPPPPSLVGSGARQQSARPPPPTALGSGACYDSGVESGADERGGGGDNSEEESLVDRLSRNLGCAIATQGQRIQTGDTQPHRLVERGRLQARAPAPSANQTHLPPRQNLQERSRGEDAVEMARRLQEALVNYHRDLTARAREEGDGHNEEADGHNEEADAAE